MSDLQAKLESAFLPSVRVEHEVSGAGMSRVFAATDVGSGKRIVIKVLPPELAGEVSSERFKREVATANRLRHANIVPVLSAGIADGLLYYTMPFIEGPTLRTVLKRDGQLPLDVCIRYATEIANALAHAHAENIVHRDVKPENVLIDGDRAVVMDSGIARAIERASGGDFVTSTGLILGTPTYMSPEQAAADKLIDGRSDIYSLGVVLYEMLTGDPPFQASSSRRMMSLHMNETAPHVRSTRPELPVEMDAVVARTLAKSFADRFQTAQHLIEALGAIPRHGAGAPSAVQPGPGGTRARRAAWTLIAAIAAVLMMVVVARTWVWPPRPEPRADPSHIAVLYFKAVGDTALAATAGGFTRDLIAALQEVPALTVISPEGVERLAHAPLDSIGRVLQVGTIVSGSLERRGGSFEATVRLVDPATSIQRGSARIQLPAAQFLLMRDSLVRHVAAQLRELLGKDVLLRAWRAQTRSGEAWVLRQQAEQLLEYETSMRRDPQDLKPQLRLFAKADSLLDGAGKADPQWPDPYVARAQIRVRLVEYLEGDRALAHIDTGMGLAARALARAPSDAAALAVRGQLRFLNVFYGGSGDSAAALLDSARADLVSATSADSHLSAAWLALSSVLGLNGDFEGSLDAAKRALASDAYLRSVPTVKGRIVYALLYAGRSEEARGLCRNAISRFPENPAVSTCEIGILGWTGRGAADIRRIGELTAENERAGPWILVGGISPIARFFTAAVLARSGLKDSALKLIDATRRITVSESAADDYWSPEAYAHLIRGDTALAIDVLQRAIELRRTTRTLVARLPHFAPLRGSDRFRELTRPR